VNNSNPQQRGMQNSPLLKKEKHMVKLINLNKTYLSKSKQSVKALNNVNIEFPSKGMIFVLGKSGSGKSTLLNILGGIDQPTSGEVIFDGKSLKDYKPADYNRYRSGYVGFVFQEFNLLKDLNVKENIALALQISKEENIDERIINALLSVGLSEDYLFRKIDELSGGEKQRIAIARAVVKQSKIILADEPTGNLDSETGEAIWNILKSLSTHQLVVIVTHDRESAVKYGDRIIEISDGMVISDTENNTVDDISDISTSQGKQKLSNKVCFKMGIKNLSQRKVKSISVVLLSIFTILSILLTQLCLSYSAEKTLVKFIEANEIDYFTINQGKLSESGNIDYQTTARYLKKSTRDYVEQNSNCIINGIIEEKQDILDFGLSFVGEALELQDNSFYITDFHLEEAYNFKSYIFYQGEKVKLVKELHPIDEIVGCFLDPNTAFGTMDYMLAGIIDTSSLSNLEKTSLRSLFYNKNFNGSNFKLSYFNDYNNSEIVLKFGEKEYSGFFEIFNSPYRITGQNGIIVTSDGIKSPEGITLSENEIILSYELYSAIFGAKSKGYYISDDFLTINAMPEYINSTYSLSFAEYDTTDFIGDLGELKIVGISFASNDFFAPQGNYGIVLSPSKYKMAGELLRVNNNILIKTNSINNLQKFLISLRTNYQSFVEKVGTDSYADYSTFAYDFEIEVNNFKIIFGAISILLVIILLLFVINLISFSVFNRKKEIGILSALGMSNKNIAKIFLIEGLIISVITFVVDAVLVYIFAKFFNQEYSKEFFHILEYFRVDALVYINLFISSFVVIFIAAIIPLLKLFKLKPIDAIKEI